MPPLSCPPGRPRLALEVLEDRTLLTAGPAPVLDLSGLAVTGSYAPDHILVQYRPGASVATLPGTRLGARLALAPRLYEVDLTGGLSVPAALAAYRRDSRVALAEPDYLLHVAGIPNDPQFRLQWGLNNTGQTGGKPGADIAAPAAWSVTTGSTKVTVAVMDTGIDYNHPDLYQNVWLNQAEVPASRKKNLRDVDGDGLITFRDLNNPVNQGAFKITDVNRDGRIDAGDILAPMQKDSQGRDTGNGGWADGISQDGDTAHVDDLVGWNFASNSNDPSDDVGHGTHVSGIIGATGNNGLGVAGIAWQTQLMPVKFLSSAGGTISNFIAGLNYAVAHGARVSNNSWVGAGNSQLLIAAIDNARAHGQIFVAAAGNDASNSDVKPVYPAGFDRDLDNVVAVTATDHNDNLASFSNYGAKTVTLAAPGVDIVSTLPGGKYGSMSGTSMSTPMVTAALALVAGQHPGWSYQQIIARVLSTTDKLPSLAGKTSSGGRLDLAAAIGAARTSTASAPRIASATATGPTPITLANVRVTFDRAMATGSFSPADCALSGPGGRVIAVSAVRPLSNSGGKTFDIVFAVQSAPGAYTLKVGPNVTDLAGNRMAVFQRTFSIRAPRTYTSTTQAGIPPGGRAVSLLTINDNFPIGDLNVKVNITDPHVGDLYIHLQAPDGTNIVLFNRSGGSTANLQGTIFDDQAATHIAQGRGPFAGPYRPMVPLSLLNGKSAKGMWKLWVENRGSSTGKLLNWSLIVTPRAG